jgi:hypothetical protein
MVVDSTNRPGVVAELGTWISDWWKAFLPAPQQLIQPILPGWTLSGLTINSGNSSAPQTEADIVQHHSYGRQLGRISDALEVLIQERGESATDDERLTDFIAMKREIDEVKLDAAASRVRRLSADLAALKQARPDEYQKLRDALATVLEAGSA